ncbi:MazG-like family protein [Kitasatospora kifunensis]|uniref:NTP pyrophosphatase (Non-canonical NTP hydrolase) n=1 Tax=Kitasatospora kifunensis TaxID=58351 RepID=A0A7W7R9A6_KITKI|nr:MazG-like family protein [Kitasatospora kifunensis]MBB4927741.1 NTP pyrophosphatase (non-canonical NTP hydrolase) [Kitasatospora kifunensis]
MDNSTWTTIRDLVAWLDEANTQPEDLKKLLRVMKLSEEVGETTQAIIGVLGQNPRKGVHATWEDVHAELCDVILTAMVALATLTPEAEEIFAKRLEHVAARSLNSTPPAGGGC